MSQFLSKLNTNKPQYSLYILSFFIVLITFPKVELDVMPGLDGSYFNFFNYYFSFDKSVLKTVLFPFGPLGFLMEPKYYGVCFELTTLYHFAIIYLLAFGVFKLTSLKKGSTSSAFFFALILCGYFRINFLSYSVILIYLLLFNKTNKKEYLFLIVPIVSIAVLIKINFAIIISSQLISFLIYTYIKEKKWKLLMIWIGTILVSFLILWLLLFRGINSLLPFILSWIELSLANSDVLVISPKNNWYFLAGVFSSSIAFILINKKQNDFKLLLSIFIPLFYIFFKYAFAREEGGHIKTFFEILVLFYSAIFLYSENINKKSWSLSLLALVLFYANLTYIHYNKKDSIRIYGVRNFINATIDRNEFRNKWIAQTKKNIKSNVFSDSVLTILNNEAIDVYPWDLNFGLVNDVNYKPRPTLQITSVPRLDEVNAQYVKNNDSLTFILWEREKWNGEVGGLDDKYLLNSDGNYLFELFNRYSTIYTQNSFYLLKRGLTRLNPPLIQNNITSKTNKWIKLPKVQSGYLRGKLKVDTPFIRKIKSAIYKTEGIYMDYKFQDESIKTYRISSDNHKTGLWLSPYLKNYNPEIIGQEVKEIRFRYVNDTFSPIANLELTIEAITFK